MFRWLIHIDTLTPLRAMPRVVTVASEIQTSPSYHHEGRHRKRDYHILFKYTLDGEGVFRDGAGEHRVPANSGFLCEVNDPAIAYYYPARSKAPWAFVYACLEGDAAHAIAQDLITRYGPIYPLPPNRGIIADLQRFGELKSRTLELSPADAGRLASDLFFALLQSKSITDSEHHEATLVRRALTLVDQRLTERLTATDVAAGLRVSREHFTRVFTARMGMSPYQHILRRKIRLACFLLKEGRLTSKEIAARLGFSEPAQFNRAFRNVTQLTPGEFRTRGVIPA